MTWRKSENMQRLRFPILIKRSKSYCRARQVRKQIAPSVLIQTPKSLSKHVKHDLKSQFKLWFDAYAIRVEHQPSFDDQPAHIALTAIVNRKQTHPETPAESSNYCWIQLLFLFSSIHKERQTQLPRRRGWKWLFRVLKPKTPPRQAAGRKKADRWDRTIRKRKKRLAKRISQKRYLEPKWLRWHY